MQASGRLHADDRIQHGFTFRSVLAEFRALRATVLRLYEDSGGTDLSQVRRFNEAVDEALTESMDRFALQTDLFRDQFIGVLSHDLRDPARGRHDRGRASGVPEDNPQRRGRVVTAHHEQRAAHGADDQRSPGPDARPAGRDDPAQAAAGGSSADMRRVVGRNAVPRVPEAVLRLDAERTSGRRLGR